MGSKGKTVFSLFLLAAGAVFLGIGMLLWTRGMGSLDGYSDEKEPYCVVKLENITELGNTYENVRAEEGYSFYELSYSVTNKGSAEFYREMPSMYYEGAEYDDVYDHYYWDTWDESRDETEAPLFDGWYETCIPPGRTGKASEVLMIKKGAASLQASYYPDYSDKELILEIPLPD